MAEVDNLPLGGSIEEVFARRKARAEQAESEPEQPTDEAPPEEGEQPEPAVEIGDDVVAETETETEPSEASLEDQPSPDLYEVTVNGETRQVDLDELRKGYMLQSDYTSKTQTVAEGRKALESEQLSLAEKLLEAEDIARLEAEDLESAEALELKDLDPQSYYERRERVEAKQKRLEKLRADRDELAAQRRASFIAEQQELVTQKIPEWIDPKAVETDIKRMSDMWTRDGLTAEEMQSEAFTHHLLLVYSRKAALYDELMASKPEDKRVKRTAPSPEPGVSSDSEPSDKRLQEAIKAHKKRGTMQTAMAVAKERRRLAAKG